jgi:hypothetical protein
MKLICQYVQFMGAILLVQKNNFVVSRVNQMIERKRCYMRQQIQISCYLLLLLM